MMQSTWRAALVWVAVAVPIAVTAAPQTGPVIAEFGPVFEIADGAYGLQPDTDYALALDVSDAPDDPTHLNRYIESAARYLNMHARAGVDMNRLKLAVVVHGPAAMSLLNDAAYQRAFGVENPNGPLLKALGDAGVAVYLCGQTAGFRDIDAQDLVPSVQMALSAMTAHTRLQAEGYSVIP